jgi:excinuclease ABC subunit A
VVASGTPEDVAACAESYTGQFLAEMLDAPAPAKKRRKVSA